jgi:hypothetical protein
MGISIAYWGKLRDPSLVPELAADLTARAQSVGWLCKTMEEMIAEGRVKAPGLEGISLYPHRESEPLHFHFDQEGTFTNHTYHAVLSDPEFARMMMEALAESAALTRGVKHYAPKEGADAGLRLTIGVPGMPAKPGRDFFKEGSRYNWTKTQWAGPKVHIAVCAMLRYVKERYAPELVIRDDSGYFQDGDEGKLAAQMAYVERLVSVTSKAVETMASEGGVHSLDAFVERLNAEIAGAKSKLH